ncbi:hypothetical protein [Aquiflexum sp.]
MKYIWLLYVGGIFFGFVLSKKLDSISRKDIRAAQKLLNLEFSKGFE